MINRSQVIAYRSYWTLQAFGEHSKWRTLLLNTPRSQFQTCVSIFYPSNHHTTVTTTLLSFKYLWQHNEQIFIANSYSQKTNGYAYKSNDTHIKSHFGLYIKPASNFCNTSDNILKWLDQKAAHHLVPLPPSSQMSLYM